MNRSTVRLLTRSAITLGLLAINVSLAAQPDSSLRFRDIPWGISTQRADSLLTTLGYTYREHAGAQRLYDAPDKTALGLVAEFNEGRLSAVYTGIVIGAGSRDSLFRALEDSLGPAAAVEANTRTWRRERSELQVRVSPSDGDAMFGYWGPDDPSKLAESLYPPLPSADWHVLREAALIDRGAGVHQGAGQLARYRMAIDTTRIEPRGDSVYHVWERHHYIRRPPEGTYDNTVGRTEYDCGEQARVRLIELTLFVGSNRRSRIITPSGEKTWVPLPPGTRSFADRVAVCEFIRSANR
jgi:hypothetical protein